MKESPSRRSRCSIFIRTVDYKEEIRSNFDLPNFEEVELSRASNESLVLFEDEIRFSIYSASTRGNSVKRIYANTVDPH